LRRKFIGLQTVDLIIILIISAVLTAPAFLLESATGEPGRRKYNKLGVIDYTKHLNKRFKKIVRKSTRYIIVHTSEAGLTSTLRSLSRGKDVGKYRTFGGHSHYVIARNGDVYRLLNHLYRADHAGLSMWNGQKDLSSHSLGIELVGYHYSSITDQQYEALTALLTTLKKIYKVRDKDVLTHSQISFGNPNMWHRRPHRGRKRCALNFERSKAGLKDAWFYDPDVKARRLVQDFHINNIFYKKKSLLASKTTPLTVPPSAKSSSAEVTTKIETITLTPVPLEPPEVSDEGLLQNKVDPGTAVNGTVSNTADGTATDAPNGTIEEAISNVISKQNTAWNIAGEEYDDSTTLYILPDNRQVRGDKLADSVGWDRIPRGTRVLLNQSLDFEKRSGPVFLLTKELTAWSYAQENYRKATTVYFLPEGRVITGNLLADWDSIPVGTRMIIGYNGPIAIKNVMGKTPWGIAGRLYNHRETIYFIPGSGVVTGDMVKDFSDLPKGSALFLKINN